VVPTLLLAVTVAQVGLMEVVLVLLVVLETTEVPVKVRRMAAVLVAAVVDRLTVESTSKWAQVAAVVQVPLPRRETAVVRWRVLVVAEVELLAKLALLVVLVVVLRSLPVAVAQAEQVEPFL
jgi:hypothetical protein